MTALTVALAATGGALAWTATEYAVHRFVFHHHERNPLNAEHRSHHRTPLATRPASRAAGHLAIAAVAATAASLASRLLPGATTPLRAAAATWSTGYSTYELVHWNAHHRDARTSYGHKVRQRHDRHHAGAPRSNLGVTVAFWDALFGTEA